MCDFDFAVKEIDHKLFYYSNKYLGKSFTNAAHDTVELLVIIVAMIIRSLFRELLES